MISRESAAVFIRILVAGSTHTDSARRLGGPLFLFFFKTFLCHGLKVGRTGCL
jgi:hypothetical protein